MMLLYACNGAPKPAGDGPPPAESAAPDSPETSSEESAAKETDLHTDVPDRPPAQGPTYDCADPPDPAPKDLEVLHMHGYFGDAVVYDFAFGDHLWWISLDAVTEPVTACHDGREFYRPIVEGGYTLDMDIQVPLGFPLDILGWHAFDELPPPEEFRFWFTILQGSPHGEEFVWPILPSSEYVHGSGGLCLSVIRPELVAGSISYRSGSFHEDPRNFFITFEFETSDPSDMATYDDGSCFRWSYFGIREDEFWDAAYWLGRASP
jgi:hypothetical protein